MISRVTIPKSPYRGFNTKITGRVNKNMLFKAASNGPIEFQTAMPASSTKTASAIDEYTGPIEFKNSSHNRNIDDATKTAAALPAAIPSALKNGFLQGLGTLGAAAAVTGAAKGIEYVGNMMNASKYDEALRTAIQMSPTLQRHGYDMLKGYMPMIIKASPTVAAEPRLLANYLESMLDAEGHLNMATMGELLALEGQVIKNNSERGLLNNKVVGKAAEGIAGTLTKNMLTGVGVGVR